MKKKIRLLSGFIFFYCFVVNAQVQLDVTHAEKDTIAFYPNVEILADSLEIYTTKTILQASFVPFTPGTCSQPHLHNYWLRTHIRTQATTKWIWEFLDPHVHQLTAYEQIGSRLVPLQSSIGFSLPFQQKKYFHKNFLFDITSAAHHPTTYYVHFKTKQVNCFLFRLSPVHTFINYALVEYCILGFYYGLLFLMALYNLAVYLQVQERVYLFYVAYVLCYAMNSFAEDGLGFQFLWGNYPAFNEFVSQWGPELLLVTFIIYSVSFLGLRRTFPRLVYGLFALCGVHTVLNGINHWFYSSTLDLRLLYLPPFLIIYFLAIEQWRRGLKQVRFFVVAYSFVLVSLIIYYLRTQGILLFHWFINIYAFNIGFILEVIVLSYALGDRLRIEKVQRETAQQKIIEQHEENRAITEVYTRQLEDKVWERTQDLERANTEIQRFNEFLKEKNLKLETDVQEITKKQATSKLISLDEFKKVYGSDEVCKEFLSDLKWVKKPYTCRKCGTDKDIPHERFYKRCASCKYVESVTASTIFHGVKIPLPEAFYMLYAVHTHKDISPKDLCQLVQVSERTCTSFKKKIQERDNTLKPKDRKNGWEYLIEVS